MAAIGLVVMGITATAVAVLDIVRARAIDAYADLEIAPDKAVELGDERLTKGLDSLAHKSAAARNSPPALDLRGRLSAAARQGRFGDTRLGHLTPGEIVVPRNVLSDELRAKLAQAFIEAGAEPGRYIVGGPDDSINPATGQPEYFFKDLWDRATDWHFEGRDDRNNSMFGTYEQVTRPGSGWKQMPEWQNAMHQDGKGKPELKFVHPYGQEIVFDGDTLQPVTGDKRGTYNYFTPDTLDSIRGQEDIRNLARNWRDHFFADMLPHMVLGPDRNKKE